MKFKMNLSNRAKWFIAAAAVLAVVLLPSLVMGTPTYPVAVVSGNSMIPTLRPGDMVVLEGVAPGHVIPNGTIVAYIPGETGVSFLDQLTRPVVVHRIVHEEYVNGSFLYTTKGDNNLVVDSPSFTDKNVIGVVVAVVPDAGFVVAFLTSAGGMVSLVAMVVLLFMGVQQDAFDSVRSTDSVLRALARLVKKGTMEGRKFDDIERELKYLGKESDDPFVRDLAGWQQKVDGMRVEADAVACAKCGGRAYSFRAGGSTHLSCPSCLALTPSEDERKADS